MSSIADADSRLARGFAAIGLDALNARAGMLTRLDHKYIVTAAAMRRAMPQLAEAFDMLEIGGRRIFDYETCYFDTPGLRAYFDHHQGRRKRVKIRMRKYCGTDLCFFEVKLKCKRGVTVKKRLPVNPEQFGSLDDRMLGFLHDCHDAQYGDRFEGGLARVLDMRYRRRTLVAKSGGERVTIDSGLQFLSDGGTLSLPQDRFIIETKSRNGHGMSDRILRQMQLHPTARVSKYCLGTALTRAGIRHNRFLPALRRMGRMPHQRTDRKAAA